MNFTIRLLIKPLLVRLVSDTEEDWIPFHVDDVDDVDDLFSGIVSLSRLSDKIPEEYWDDETLMRSICTLYVDNACDSAASFLAVDLYSEDNTGHARVPWDSLELLLEIKSQNSHVVNINDALADFLEEFGVGSLSPSSFSDAYAGEQSLESYAREFIASCYNIGDLPERWIDYEAVASDLEDVYVEGFRGHLFMSNF